MANTIIGSVAGGVLMPGATLIYESDGSITGTAKYAFPQGASASLIGLGHPDNSGALAVSELHEYDEVFQYVTGTYRGVWSSSNYRVDVQTGLQANPIETHPNFVSTLGGTPGAPLNGAVFDNNGVFLGWPAGASLHLGGVRYFLAAANTYRFTAVTTNATTIATALGNTGAIASSVSAGGLTVTQTNGFMLQNVTLDYQYVGGATTVYTYTVVWVSTQPPGWNTNIYPP